MDSILGYDCDGCEIEEFRILRAPFSADIENWDEEPNVDPRFYCVVVANNGESYAISAYDDYNREAIRRYENITDNQEILAIVKPISEMENYEVAFDGIFGNKWFYDRDRVELKNKLENILKEQTSKQIKLTRKTNAE